MRRALIALGVAAVAVFVGALVLLETHEDPAPLDNPGASSAPDVDKPPPNPSRPTQPSPRASEDPVSPSPTPGFKLGKGSSPDARSNAQAILDDALAELRRLDASQQTLARDVYMRGHSAAERVEDELEKDDEPGLATLRAHEGLMKAELRRIYGADDSTQRP